jgi:hypothetical protein
MALIVVLPMIPSFLFFKYLPDKTAVSGPFLRGLRINLQGGFAGYFVVFIVLLVLYKDPPAISELWTVEGPISLQDDDGRGPEAVRVRISPPVHETVGTYDARRFIVRVSRILDTPNFPVLLFQTDGYIEHSLTLETELNQGRASVTGERRIEVSAPVIIRRPPRAGPGKYDDSRERLQEVR